MPSLMPTTAPARADSGRKIPVALLPSVPCGTGYAGAFTGVIGDRLFAGGGANFPDGVMPWNGGKKVWHDTLMMLDLRAPERGWRTVGRLPEPNGYGVSLTTREGIILIGGGNATEHFRAVRLLSLSADGEPAFSRLPDLPTGLAQMCGALVGRRIHLCGGIESPEATVSSNVHLALDLDAPEDGWTELPALPAPGRILATAAALDGAFHVIGGCALAADVAGKPVRAMLDDVWKFSGGRWTRLARLPHPLVAAGSPAPVADDAIFLVSGDDGSQAGLASPDDHRGFPERVLRYDTAADQWSCAGQLAVPPPVTVPVAPWNETFVFFNGEVRPGVRTPQVFSFDPSRVTTTIA